MSKTKKEPTIKTISLRELAEWGLFTAMQSSRGRKTCAACGAGFDNDLSHVDDYHRFTPLCTDCYYDKAAWHSTAFKIEGQGHRNSPETEGCDDSGPPISH